MVVLGHGDEEDGVVVQVDKDARVTKLVLAIRN
jgi:hypothetical protein